MNGAVAHALCRTRNMTGTAVDASVAAKRGMKGTTGMGVFADAAASIMTGVAAAHVSAVWRLEMKATHGITRMTVACVARPKKL